MSKMLLVVLVASLSACATLTEEAMTPVALSFSDGSEGQCNLQNKRGAWPTPIPVTVEVRKSDDALKYECTTQDGRKAFGSIPSEMGGKIIASAVFIDFGITDAITDKHRRYAASYVIPMTKSGAPAAQPATASAAAPAVAPAAAPAAAPVAAQSVAPAGASAEAPTSEPTTAPAVTPAAATATAPAMPAEKPAEP